MKMDMDWFKCLVFWMEKKEMNKLWSVVPEMKMMMREGLLCRQSGKGGGRGESAERKAD